MSRASLATGSGGGGGLWCGSETDSWPLSVFSKSVKWGTCIKVKYSCTKKFKVVVMLARRKALQRQQCFSLLVLPSVLPDIPLPPNTAILPTLDKKSWHSSCFFHSIMGSAGISPCSTLLQHHLSAISAALQVNCISLKFFQFCVWIMLSVSVSLWVKLAQLCSWSPKSDEVFYPGSLVTGYSVTVWSWHAWRLFIIKLHHPHG